MLMLTTHQKYLLEKSNSSIRFGFPYRKLWVMVLGLSWGIIITVGFSILSFLQALMPEVINLPIFVPLPFFIVLIPITLLSLIELLWLMTGLEVVEINNNQIVVKHLIYGIGISKKFNANEIDGVFVSHQNNDWLTYSSKGIKFLDFKKGMIAINSGKTLLGGTGTFRFGSAINTGEAQEIVQTIHQQFPQYQYRKSQKTG